MSQIRVIKCSCHGTTFSRLNRIARLRGVSTIEGLKRHATFAENCRRCVPYVKLMLRTGEVEFDLLEELPSEAATVDQFSSSESYGDEDEL